MVSPLYFNIPYIASAIASTSQKSILIPLPKSQQNEQFLNANWVKEQLPNQTIIINQNEFNQKNLIQAIEKLKSIKITNKIKDLKPNLNLLKLIHEII